MAVELNLTIILVAIILVAGAIGVTYLITNSGNHTVGTYLITNSGNYTRTTNSSNSGINATYRITRKVYYPSGLTSITNVTNFRYIKLGSDVRLDLLSNLSFSVSNFALSNSTSIINISNLSYFSLSNQLYACYTTKSKQQVCLKDTNTTTNMTTFTLFSDYDILLAYLFLNSTFNTTLNTNYYSQLRNKSLVYSNGYPCYLVSINIMVGNEPIKFTQCISTKYNVPIFTEAENGTSSVNISVISINNNVPESYFRLPYPVT